MTDQGFDGLVEIAIVATLDDYNLIATGLQWLQVTD
jgi:hypothetical protein